MSKKKKANSTYSGKGKALHAHAGFVVKSFVNGGRVVTTKKTA